MNVALLRKALRDYLPLWAAVLALLMGFVILYMPATKSIRLDASAELLRLEWLRRLISALIGSDLLDSITPTGIVSLAFSHPLTWTLILSFLITTASGLMAGEIDRGTMDLLATLPISRGCIYGTFTFAVLVAGLPLCWAVWLAVWLGGRLADVRDVSIGALVLIPWHLYAVYVFVACLSLTVSSLCSRRGTAVAITFVVVFYAFVLNLIAAFWQPAKQIAFTGFLHYYAPLPIARDQTWRVSDIAVLLTGAAVCWLVGWVAFSRRDIPAR